MKKIAKIVVCLAFVFAMLLPAANITWAASGDSSVAISNTSPSVGEQVTVTFSVKSDTEMMGGDIYIDYDSSVLELASGASGSGGSAIIQDAYQGEATKSFSANVTFKVIAVGTARVGVNGQTVVEAAYSSDKWNIAASSASISVTGGSSQGSSTNTLSALSVAAVNNAGTATELKLSPAFSAGTTTYSTAAPSDTVKLSISATTSDGSATTSVRYANMDPGDNKTYIDVKAENGDVLTYVIQTKVDDAAYEASKSAEEETTTVDPNAEPANKEVQATLAIDGKTITVLTPDDTIMQKAPKGFSKVELQIDGKNIEGWICDNDENYCLMYAENENGEKGFYLYDLKEKTIMRYSDKLMSAEASDDNKEISSFDKNFKIISYAIIGALAVVAVIFIILFFKQRNKAYDDEFEDDDENEEDDDEFEDEDEDDESDDEDDEDDEDDDDEYIFKKPKKAKEKRRKMSSEDLTPEEMEFLKQVRAEEEKRMADERKAEEARKAEVEDFFETEIDMDEFENKKMDELDKEIIQSGKAVEKTLENEFDFLDLEDNEGM